MIELSINESFWVNEQRAGRTIPESGESWALSRYMIKSIFAGTDAPPPHVTLSAEDLSDREMAQILMRRHNIEQSTVAALCGVSRVTINRRLRGHEDISDTLIMLLTYLDLMDSGGKN